MDSVPDLIKLRELIGKEMEVKVIDVNEKEEKLIVSEKAVWEDSQKAVLTSITFTSISLPINSRSFSKMRFLSPPVTRG